MKFTNSKTNAVPSLNTNPELVKEMAFLQAIVPVFEDLEDLQDPNKERLKAEKDLELFSSHLKKL